MFPHGIWTGEERAIPKYEFELLGPVEEIVSQQLEITGFLVDPIIPSGGIALLFGKEGHFKTFLALTLSRSLALGEPFLSTFPAKQSKVAYVGVDMPPWEIQDRFRGIAEEIGERAPKSILVASRGASINIMETPTGDPWVRKIVDFDPDLIIFDTLRKIHLLLENESLTVAAVYHQLRRLFGPHPTLTLLHHQRKDHFNPEFQRSTPAELMLRGSSAWLADSDVGIQIKKYLHKGEERVIVSFPRLRFCAPQGEIICALDTDKMILEPLELRKFDPRDLAERIITSNPGVERAEVIKLIQKGAKVSRVTAWRYYNAVSDE